MLCFLFRIIGIIQDESDILSNTFSLLEIPSSFSNIGLSLFLGSFAFIFSFFTNLIEGVTYSHRLGEIYRLLKAIMLFFALVYLGVCVASIVAVSAQKANSPKPPGGTTNSSQVPSPLVEQLTLWIKICALVWSLFLFASYYFVRRQLRIVSEQLFDVPIKIIVSRFLRVVHISMGCFFVASIGQILKLTWNSTLWYAHASILLIGNCIPEVILGVLLLYLMRCQESRPENDSSLLALNAADVGEIHGGSFFAPDGDELLMRFDSLDNFMAVDNFGNNGVVRSTSSDGFDYGYLEDRNEYVEPKSRGSEVVEIL